MVLHLIISFFTALVSNLVAMYSRGFPIHSFDPFFVSVACQVIKLQLGKLGFDSEFLQCQIEVNDNKVWDGIRRKYWHGRDVYYLPRITWNQEFIGRKTKAHCSEEHVDMNMDEAIPKRQRR